MQHVCMVNSIYLTLQDIYLTLQDIYLTLQVIRKDKNSVLRHDVACKVRRQCTKRST